MYPVRDTSYEQFLILIHLFRKFQRSVFLFNDIIPRSCHAFFQRSVCKNGNFSGQYREISGNLTLLSGRIIVV
jgi:hypothetical protein